jgi:predicted Rossmann-fold nucleotide-binding protein
MSFFELLTPSRPAKWKPIPIVLFGKDFVWLVIDFEALADEGTINHDDLKLFQWCVRPLTKHGSEPVLRIRSQNRTA